MLDTAMVTIPATTALVTMVEVAIMVVMVTTVAEEGDMDMVAETMMAVDAAMMMADALEA